MVQPRNLEGGLLYSITLDLRVVGVKVSDLLAQSNPRKQKLSQNATNFVLH